MCSSDLITAVTLRLAYLNWGFPYTFHIDEETIILFTQKIAATWKSQHQLINPSTSWGNLIFITLGVISKFLFFLKNAFDSEQLFLIFTGRMISASLSFLGLGVIYLLARRLYNQQVALLSLAFNAVLVVLIRAGHIYTLEVFLFILIGLTLLAGEKISRRGLNRDYFWTFFYLGLALSSKVTTALLMIPIVYAHYQVTKKQSNKFFNKQLFFAAVAITLYALLNPGILKNYLTGQVTGTTDILWVAKQMFGLVKPSWTLHFEGLPRFWYEITHNFWYGMGPFLEITMLAGVVFCLYRRKRSDIYLLLWLLPYFLLIGSWRSKYIRFIVPLVPYGLILGAAFWVEIFQKIKTSNWQRYAYLLVMGGGLLSTLLYAIAFTNVYAGPDSRIQAYQWAKTNIPAGATLLLERDESLRLPFNKQGVKVLWLDREILYYQLSGEEKIPYLAAMLKRADYIIVGEANKIRYLHTPQLNPIEYLYYTLLDSGELGFQKVKEYKVYPHLGPITINDERAEQSFHLFDHPRVEIYKREQRLNINSILFGELMKRFPTANL